jgi:hypothetical protein
MVRPTTPPYAWICPACGNSNEAGLPACFACGCGASAKFSQIKAYRAEFESKGGALLRGAAQLDDPDGAELLESVLTIFGFLPSGLKAILSGLSGK